MLRALTVLSLLLPGATASNLAAVSAVYPPADAFAAYREKHPWSVNPDLVSRKVPISGALPETNFDETLVPPFVLPKLLMMADKTPVTTIGEWESRRRPELLELFRREIYGFAPPRPGDLAFKVVSADPSALDGRATCKRVAISFALGGESFVFHLTLFVPNRRTAAAPVFLLINHRAATPAKPGPIEVRGEFWPVEYGVGRGYAMAIVDEAAEVDPDRANATTGVRAFYRKHQTKPDEYTWGMIAAWAWAASRSVDYLVTDTDIDSSRIAVIGHSRGGKTALWAGAQDTRFSLVVPNNSGDAGTALIRRRFGNNIEIMTGRNPHWLVPKYATYAHQEKTLPVDGHLLIALVAPRGLAAGDGSDDLWSDPRGSWLALAEASRIWALEGKAKPMDDPMPLVNDLLVNGAISYHLRDGGHGLLLFDWKLYFDYADRFFAQE